MRSFSFPPSCFNAPQGLGKNRLGESDSLGSYCHVRKGVRRRGKQQSWLPNVGCIQQRPRDTFQWETSKPDKTQQELPICSPPLLFTKLLKTYLPAWGAKSLLLPCRWWEQPGACVRSTGVMKSGSSWVSSHSLPAFWLVPEGRSFFLRTKCAIASDSKVLTQKNFADQSFCSAAVTTAADNLSGGYPFFPRPLAWL